MRNIISVLVLALVLGYGCSSGDGSDSSAETPVDLNGTSLGVVLVTGRTLTFSLTQDDPCPGTFTGSATVASSGIAFSGPYSGFDCSGTTNAWFSVSK